MVLKFVKATDFYVPMTEEETRCFLTETKTLLRIGSIGPGGYPDVHVIWYAFQDDKIYAHTLKGSKKFRNLQSNNKVGFSIDNEAIPYKGVRGRAKAILVDDVKLTTDVMTKNILKYVGTLDHSYAKELLSMVPQIVVIELTPLYLATWDESKQPK